LAVARSRFELATVNNNWVTKARGIVNV